MKKINLRDIKVLKWSSPKGKFRGTSQEISVALGRVPSSTDLMKRHPFDVEILRVKPGQTPYPYHSHSAQWEFYHVLSGRGLVRHKGGRTRIIAGDSFIFPPGQPHTLHNDSRADLVICVVADNPIGESGYYPDSKKWIVKSPARRLLRSAPLDYYDGEE